VRVCGDLSQSVNPFLAVGGRALPHLDNLSLVNGKFFCVLDLAQAYLQLRLGSASREVLKLNTLFGMYRCLRMPYGITSAPKEFQEIICTILAGVRNIFIKAYNNLPPYVKEESQNPRKFKTCLVHFLQTHYFSSIEEYFQYKTRSYRLITSKH
jgi:hypothetical protein